MPVNEHFIATVQQSYAFQEENIILGGAMEKEETITDLYVRAPLRNFSRHGLIAGATGTGKTKSLQVLAEQLSASGVPVLLMDVKGDLSGLAEPSPGHKKIDERMSAIGLPFEPQGYPVELLTLSNEKGVRLRATVTEFGPVLFSKILDLNETQSGIMAMIFKYCDDNDYPLINLDDVKKILQWVKGEGADAMEEEYGTVSSSSVGAIMRKIVALEQEGAEVFFGEPSFDVEDLCRFDEKGQGYINIVRLVDIQGKPALFSTFMLQLLAEVYSTFPEEGDIDIPKLVIFIDEAHLIFKEASDALLDQLEVVIKLIRSKGVGIFFCTQSPDDIPNEVLGQLGMKIQHALRAFTAKDRKAIKLAAQNFPISEFYDVEQLLTEVGLGEALVSVLDEDARPTTLVRTMMRAPQSRMDVLSSSEINSLVKSSEMVDKYDKEVDRESAEEIINMKMEAAKEEERKQELDKQREKEKKASSRGGGRKRSSRSYDPWERALNNASSQLGRTVAREVARGILGVLGVKKRRR